MEVILICLAIAVVAAFLVTGVMRSQLKSVRPQNTAGNYTVDGSFRLAHRQDHFLYQNTIRQRRPDSSNQKRS